MFKNRNDVVIGILCTTFFITVTAFEFYLAVKVPDPKIWACAIISAIVTICQVGLFICKR